MDPSSNNSQWPFGVCQTPESKSALQRTWVIPELREAVLQYLRPKTMAKLRRLNRFFYQLFPPALTLRWPDLSAFVDSEALTLLASAESFFKVRALELDLSLPVSDMSGQMPELYPLLEALEVYRSMLRSHPLAPLDRVTISLKQPKLLSDPDGIKSILKRLPAMRGLTLVVGGYMPLTEVMQAVTSTLTGKEKVISREETHAVECNENGSLEDTHDHGRSNYLNHPQNSILESFSIEIPKSSHRDGDTSALLEYGTLRAFLDAFPSLRSLSMKGVMLDFPLESYGVVSGFQDCDSLKTYPNVKDLILDSSVFRRESVVELDRLFPRLDFLEMAVCDSQSRQLGTSLRFTKALNMADSAGAVATGGGETTDDNELILFKNLTGLRYWCKDMHWGLNPISLLRDRPNLVIFECDIPLGTRQAIFDFIQFCSQPTDSSDDPSIGDTTTTAMDQLDDGTLFSTLPQFIPGKKVGREAEQLPRHLFKRLLFQTYVSGGTLGNLELEQLYKAPCFQRLNYLYMQATNFSERCFPFAETLTSLRLGGAGVYYTRSDILNAIFQRTHRLQDLVIEFNLKDYLAFDPHYSKPGLIEPSPAQPRPADQSEQRPSGVSQPTDLTKLTKFLPDLTSLEFCFGTLGQPFCLHQLKSMIVDRMTTLETLTVLVRPQQSLDRSQVDQWMGTLPEGIAVRFER
ncbi:hypothetical protein BGW38_007878 [Lunasporangiospora selenospora]|uniref:Uncharacterized protein n=1 Tax=Lunasporangiospora selenospora TaxID=979761 RepID=A0A9P6KGM9_9FUNG|nr:hypothetical protein BGW38_007878 [Lunasporangiospora selenospora]